MLNKQTVNHDCISLCWEARTVCQDTLINHCLLKGGEHIDPEHVKIMLDCIEICQITADFMKRNSLLHTTVCYACTDICEACATSCEEMAGDEKMQRCAEICRRCAEACRLEARKLNKAA